MRLVLCLDHRKDAAAGLGAFVTQHPWLAAITITDRARIDPFAEFGILLLLFAIGLELSFRRLWAMKSAVFGLGALQMLATAALVGVYGAFTQWRERRKGDAQFVA